MCAVSNAVAQGGYVGFGGGWSPFDDDYSDVGAGLFSESDMGWTVCGGGYRFLDNLRAEGYLLHFGSPAGKVADLPLELEAYGYGASAMVVLSIGSKFQLFGKGGGAWKSVGTVSAREEGAEAILGLGAFYSVSKHSDVRLEFETVTSGTTDLSMLSVGTALNF